MSKVCAIVDGYSSGKYLVKEFAKYGYRVFHIASSNSKSKFFDNSEFKKDYFEHILFDVENKDSVLVKIKDLNPEFILAGAEIGVSLCDWINHELNMTLSNDFEFSDTRRDKYALAQRLHEARVPSSQHFKAQSISQAVEWAERFNQWPIVAKPVNSAGSDSIYFCNDVKEVEDAFRRIKGQVNQLGIINEAVLLQEYLDGTEFVVNTVSYDGYHKVTEIVKYTKKRSGSGGILYDIDELQESDCKESQQLIPYIQDVLSAIGLKYGPCHAEVMLTSNGPILIEIGSRTDGILKPEVSAKTTGAGQIWTTAFAFANPTQFKATIADSYILKNYTINLSLISNVSGKLKNYLYLDEIKSLASFNSFDLRVNEGDKIEVTENAFNQPGTIYLIHQDKNVIKKDYATIRDYEKNGLYNV